MNKGFPKQKAARCARLKLLLATLGLLLGGLVAHLALTSGAGPATAILVASLAIAGLPLVIATGSFAAKAALGDWPAERRGPARRWWSVWCVEVAWMIRLYLWDQPLRRPRWQIEPAGGTPLMLVHGFCCNGAVWSPLLDAFAPGRRSVVAVSLEPFYLDIEAQLARLDAAVCAVCAASGQDGVVLAGHSMGGLLSRIYAARHPERVRACLMVAAPHRGTLLAAGLGAAERGPPTPRARWLADFHVRAPVPAMPAINLWTPDDNLVVPAESSAEVPGVPSRALPGLGHLAIIAAESGRQACAAALAELLMQADERSTGAQR